ncbi:MAG: ComEC/Rec2 family competence protein [Lentisphaeria bacterium]|nr:ComEC/Rec2 family competence protein [Lentisphaeria bacterium]
MHLPAMYILLLILPALAALLVFFKKYRECIILIIAILLGLSSCFWHFRDSTPPFRNSSRLEKALLTITDTNAIGKALHPDERLPHNIEAELHTDSGTGPVMLRFPRRYPNFGVAGGEKYFVTGTLERLPPPGRFFLASENGSWLDVSKNFQRSSYFDYLQRRKIGGILTVENLEIHPESSINTITAIRRAIAERLDCGIKNADHRAVISAIVIGLRGRLSSGTKFQYNSVGASHLFSVSGLHVGILAMLFLFCLRPLPLAWHWTLLTMLAFYTAATGGNAPAIRAFAMVLAVEFFRSRLLRVNPLELLSLICASLLLVNPYYLTDAGFQYSFIITALLITAARPAQAVTRAAMGCAGNLGENNLLKRFAINMFSKLSGAVFFGAVAAASSIILTTYWQHSYFAGTVLVNLLILPVLPFIFTASLLKTAMPFAGKACNFILENLAGYLDNIIGFFHRFSGNIELMHPSWLYPAAMIILLALLLQLRNKIAAITVLILLGTIVGIMFQRSGSAVRSAAVIVSGGTLRHPVAAIMLPQAHTMYVLNAGYDSVFLLRDAAAHYGIAGISRLDIAYPVIDCASGLEQLTKAFPTDCIRTPGKPVRSTGYKKIISAFHTIPGAESQSISPGGLKEVLQIRSSPDGGSEVRYKNRRYNLPATAYPEVYIIEEAE